VKKYSSIFYLIRPSNMVKLFYISRWPKMESGVGSLKGAHDRESVREDKERDFYSNSFPNDDLESKLKRNSWRYSG
jgi:hypothetical protein